MRASGPCGRGPAEGNRATVRVALLLRELRPEQVSASSSAISGSRGSSDRQHRLIGTVGSTCGPPSNSSTRAGPTGAAQYLLSNAVASDCPGPHATGVVADETGQRLEASRGGRPRTKSALIVTGSATVQAAWPSSSATRPAAQAGQRRSVRSGSQRHLRPASTTGGFAQMAVILDTALLFVFNSAAAVSA